MRGHLWKHATDNSSIGVQNMVQAACLPPRSYSWLLPRHAKGYLELWLCARELNWSEIITWTLLLALLSQQFTFHRFFSKYLFTGHCISCNNSIKVPVYCWELWCWIRSHYKKTFLLLQRGSPLGSYCWGLFIRTVFLLGFSKTFANIFSEAYCVQASSVPYHFRNCHLI